MAVGAVVGRDGWVGCEGSEGVDGDFKLGDKFVPFGERKFGICPTQCCYHVIFRRSPSTFGAIGAMVVGRNVLDNVHVLVQVDIKFMGGLIVESNDVHFVSKGLKESEGGCIGADEFCC